MIKLDDLEVGHGSLIPPSELSNEDYHKSIGISPSGIKQAWKEPKLYAKRGELMRLPSPALTIGTAVHEALLEPERFDINNYSLTNLQQEKLKIMVNNGRVMFDYILRNTKNEYSLYVKDNGFTRRVRMDAYDEEHGIIYDLKTTQYNDKHKFLKDFYARGYHLQASFYIDTLRLAGYKADFFGFLCIPSENPFEPFSIQVSDRYVEDGRGLYTEVVEKMLEYKSSGANSVSFEIVDLPSWRLKQIYGEV